MCAAETSSESDPGVQKTIIHLQTITQTIALKVNPKSFKPFRSTERSLQEEGSKNGYSQWTV
jgi:hypothetical protein